MLTNGQRRIKMAALFAASNEALGMAQYLDYGTGFAARKEALDLMESAGFPRCLVDEDNILPLSHGVIRSEEGDSWTSWVFFSRKEVEAYAAAFGETWFDDSKDYEPGNPCPECGANAVVSRKESYYCQACEAWMDSRETRLEELQKAIAGFDSYSKGPGRAFGHTPTIKVGRNHIIITQHGGLDI